MNEYDSSIPHDLTGVIFRDPHQCFGMTYSCMLGSAYSGGNVSGNVTRLQIMPGGAIVATIRQSQGRIGADTRVLLNGWISADLQVDAPEPEKVAGPTPAQEKARERAAKAVQA